MNDTIFLSQLQSIRDIIQQADVGELLAGTSAIALIVLWAVFSMGKVWKGAYDGMPEPPMLPGYIPILGHAISWFKDSSKIHQRAR
jgi:hypothetical protein